jgi:Tol biopolymer transport system component
VSRKVGKDTDVCWRYPSWQGNARVTFVSGSCDPDYLDYTYSTAVVEVPSGRIVSSLKGTNRTDSPMGHSSAYLEPVGNDVRLIEVGPAPNRLRLSPQHGTVDDVAWSPNGHFLAYSYSRDAGEQVYVVNSSGGRPRRVTHELSASSESDLTWSHAVSCSYCDAETQRGIWVLRPDGTGLSRVAAISGMHPTWSPDGTTIAFSGPCGPAPAQNTNPDYQLCIVGADGSNLHAVTTWPYCASAPSWSRP